MKLFRPALQLLALLAASSMPLWIEHLVSADSPYLHLLTEPRYYLQIIAMAGVAILLPQLASLVGFIVRGTVVLAFYVAAHVGRRGRPFRVLLIIGPALAAVGLASAVQGVAAYGYSVYREYKYSSEVSRQIAVEGINRVDREKGPIASAAALRVMLERYPTDSRNSAIRRRISDIEAATLLTEELDKEADAMAEAGFHFRALELYRTAKDVFPYDTRSSDAIAAYIAEFESQHAQLSAFYTLCGERSAEGVADAVPQLTLLFWDADAIVAKLNGGSIDERDRALAAACARTNGHASPDAFVRSLRAALFGEQA